MTDRSRSLMIIALCQVAAMSLWFSASAVAPALVAEAILGPAMASLFTSAVQLGFVVGTLISAGLMLADRYDPRKLFMAAALVGAGANGLILAVEPGSSAVIPLRIVTGLCMAGVYPVGMKLAVTWARGDLGLLIGALVGALTLGSAMPFLLNGLGGIDWRATIAGASMLAALAGVGILFAAVGPNHAPAPRFQWGLAFEAFSSRGLRLVNLGYLGHMWELYAMWAWIGLFLQESFFRTFADPAQAPVAAAYATFATIGAGAVGCLLGGVFADRFGRTTLTMSALAVSGACALVVGHLVGASPVLVVGICLVWGVSVVADSPQFSAAIAELSEPSLVGTMLTVQTCVGFLLTLISIHLVPVAIEAWGWGGAFSLLALGPVVGLLAMGRLRGLPEAKRLANGRR